MGGVIVNDNDFVKDNDFSDDMDFILEENLDENVEIIDDIVTERSTKEFVFDWLEVLVHAIIVVVICFSFLFRIATIDGSSMENTLYNGEKIVISNLFYEPKVGDIVVISRNKENSIYTMDSSNTPIIKRIIAVEGQMVDIDFEKGIVYVDGVALDEPYTKTPTNVNHGVKFPVIVDKGCVFVLGDNRNDSFDSRSPQIGEYGMIDTRYILGKALFRILPLDKIGGIDND